MVSVYVSKEYMFDFTKVPTIFPVTNLIIYYIAYVSMEVQSNVCIQCDTK